MAFDDKCASIGSDITTICVFIGFQFGIILLHVLAFWSGRFKPLKASADLEHGVGLNKTSNIRRLQTIVIQNESVTALRDAIHAAFAKSKVTTTPAETSNVRVAIWDRDGVSSEAWLVLMPFHEIAGACPNKDGSIEVYLNHTGGWNNVATLALPRPTD
ncbi:uncharacterized protein N7503_009110 [Penicillium pulvis]|uniref:uncharacterized protein n=1 Tax=Penicillium pulvis TaxID=1562058 RepID=UPI002547469A|nr:uncharacterized protein N7503_009110 [Penicillium pulvis]KAJ5793132.1 hypothetical protein N7503_009110 [Penicillium pulvis]